MLDSVKQERETPTKIFSSREGAEGAMEDQQPRCLDRRVVPDPDIFFESDPELLPKGERVFPATAAQKSQFRRARTEFEIRAQMVCVECPVREWCARLGMDQEWGVWGSFTAAERRVLREGGAIRTRDLGAGGARRDEAVTLFQKGFTIDQVADKMGLERDTVMGHLGGFIKDATKTHAFVLSEPYGAPLTGGVA